MKILLDECLDWRLSRELGPHEVKTARQMGWTSIKNGELLTLAAQSFDVFLTADGNLSFQQKLTGLPIAVIVLRSKSNRLDELKRLVPELLSALHAAKAGMATVVGDAP